MKFEKHHKTNYLKKSFDHLKWIVQRSKGTENLKTFNYTLPIYMVSELTRLIEKGFTDSQIKDPNIYIWYDNEAKKTRTIITVLFVQYFMETDQRRSIQCTVRICPLTTETKNEVHEAKEVQEVAA